jgi:hypothetical protein
VLSPQALSIDIPIKQQDSVFLNDFTLIKISDAYFGSVALILF